MKKYQFQIVRYIHDRVSSEFVNIGIIVFQPETSFLKARFINKYGRISQFFNEINGKRLISTLKQFEKKINLVARDSNFESENLKDITSIIIPVDDGAIVCSNVNYGIDVDCNIALNDLFERLVNKYTEPEKQLYDDKYVWKNVYKTHFDKYGITGKLKSHTVKTTHDDINFDKAWKNNLWHCYEPISFDLKQLDSIKGKIYKWSGILSELEKSDENIHLHFLTKNPTTHTSIIGFINDTFLSRKQSQVKVSLVNENQAEEFAMTVSKEIAQHEASEEEA